MSYGIYDLSNQSVLRYELMLTPSVWYSSPIINLDTGGGVIIPVRSIRIPNLNINESRSYFVVFSNQITNSNTPGISIKLRAEELSQYYPDCLIASINELQIVNVLEIEKYPSDIFILLYEVI